MAAYRRVYGFGHLRADCRGLGSAPEPYAQEYGSILHLPLLYNPDIPECWIIPDFGAARYERDGDKRDSKLCKAPVKSPPPTYRHTDDLPVAQTEVAKRPSELNINVSLVQRLGRGYRNYYCAVDCSVQPLSLLIQQAVCGRPSRYAPAPLLPRGRWRALHSWADSNVAAVSHGQHVPMLTAAAAWRANVVVSKAAWWPWPWKRWPSHMWRGLTICQF